MFELILLSYDVERLLDDIEICYQFNAQKNTSLFIGYRNYDHQLKRRISLIENIIYFALGKPLMSFSLSLFSNSENDEEMII